MAKTKLWRCGECQQLKLQKSRPYSCRPCQETLTFTEVVVVAEAVHEIERLRGVMRYAAQSPNLDEARTLLVRCLDGVIYGADDLERAIAKT